MELAREGRRQNADFVVTRLQFHAGDIGANDLIHIIIDGEKTLGLGLFNGGGIFLRFTCHIGFLIPFWEFKLDSGNCSGLLRDLTDHKTG